MKIRYLANFLILAAASVHAADFSADNLEANAPTVSTQAGVKFSDQGSLKYMIGKSAYNTLFMWDHVNSKDFLRVTSGGSLLLQPVSGDVGIGTTTPSTSLHVRSGAGTTGALWIDSAWTNIQASIKFLEQGEQKFALGKQAGNGFFIWNNTYSRDIFRGNTDGSVSVQPVAGNVGIGKGVTPVGTDNTIVGRYNDTRTNDGGINHTDGVFTVGCGSDNTNRANAIRVLADGTVLVKSSGDISMGDFTDGPRP